MTVGGRLPTFGLPANVVENLVGVQTSTQPLAATGTRTRGIRRDIMTRWIASTWDGVKLRYVAKEGLS